jgi:hypothetical protein
LTAAIRAHPDTDFFHSSRRVIDEQDQPLSSVHRSRAEFALTDFVGGSPVKHLLCWRRAKGLAVGGLDESLNSVGPDDYDFPWTMAEHGPVSPPSWSVSTSTATTATASASPRT